LPLAPPRFSLHVARLVELHGDSPRCAEVRDHAVAAVFDGPGELHAALFHLRDGALDVVAVERHVVAAGVLGILDRMHAQIALGEVEDPPTLADVVAGQLDLVAEERARRLRVTGVEEAVDAADHLPSFFAPAANSSASRAR